MERVFKIINPDGRGQETIQDLLNEGFEIEKMVPLNIHSTSNYSNVVHGQVAVYLIRHF